MLYRDKGKVGNGLRSLPFTAGGLRGNVSSPAGPRDEARGRP